VGDVAFTMWRKTQRFFIQHELNSMQAAVSWSATILAAQRALELLKNDPLMKDPFAQELLPMDTNMQTPDRIMHAFWKERKLIEQDALFRGRMIDREIEKFAVEIGDKPWQLILLGAGLDTRAYRMDGLQNCRVYELDHFPVLEFKRKRLERYAHGAFSLQRVEGDLGQSRLKFRKNNYFENLRTQGYTYWDEALIKCGFKSDIPSFWVLEGILMYKGRQQVVGLLKTLRSVTNSKGIICADVIVDRKNSKHEWRNLFLWDCPKKDISKFFLERKWIISSMDDITKDSYLVTSKLL
jgi:methyltransferase (TIGR00027 family)